MSEQSIIKNLKAANKHYKQVFKALGEAYGGAGDTYLRATNIDPDDELIEANIANMISIQMDIIEMYIKAHEKLAKAVKDYDVMTAYDTNADVKHRLKNLLARYEKF